MLRPLLLSRPLPAAAADAGVGPGQVCGVSLAGPEICFFERVAAAAISLAAAAVIAAVAAAAGSWQVHGGPLAGPEICGGGLAT